jgi:hypothetical protein
MGIAVFPLRFCRSGALKANPLPDNGFISPHAWDACASEALDAINNRNKETA